MNEFSQALAIAIACILSFGLVAHRVLSSIVEQKFAELELSVLKSRREILENKQELRKLEKEIQELKFLLRAKESK